MITFTFILASLAALGWVGPGPALAAQADPVDPAASRASLAPVTASTVALPLKLDRAAADTIKKKIEKDREETREWLKGKPTSYLATVSRRDFGDQQTMTVGRAADNDMRIDDPALLAHHLRVTVQGDSFKVEALDEGAHFRIGQDEHRSATVGPSSIGVGRFLLRLSHQRFPAIIVFDPESPRFKEYKGIRYYPVDLRYRYLLPLTVNPEPDTVIIMSTRGNARRAIRVGWFDFKVGKMACRLEATRLLEPGVGEKDFGIFFRDATTGKDTYGVGRYLDVAPVSEGQFLLDFNLAYSPACAYSEHYNCPIPPKANTLAVAIKAGERDPHYLAH